jgi:hypothetical protein
VSRRRWTKWPGERGRAFALLLGFVVSLVLGAFHPLGLAPTTYDHVCHRGGERHVDAPAHPDHDAGSCSFCHLALGLAGEAVAPPTRLDAPAPDTRAATSPVDRRPRRAAATVFRSRSPPAA